MNLSQRGLMELASHEGIVLSPYYDSVGVLTIGIGHTAGAGAPNPASFPLGAELPVAEVLAIFRRDVPKYEAGVRKAFNRPLTQEQFDAAVSFHFNTGAIGRATWVKKFNAGDMAGARKSIMDWRKPPEIVPRRQKERDLFFAGTYSNVGRANVYPADNKGRVQWAKGRVVNLAEILGAGAPEPAAPLPVPQKPAPAAPDATVSQSRPTASPPGQKAAGGKRIGIIAVILGGLAALVAALWPHIERMFQ